MRNRMLAAMLLVIGLASPATAVVQPAHVEVVDSLGHVLGAALEAPSPELAKVSLLVDSHLLVAVNVHRYYLTNNRTVVSNGADVFFVSSDCTGQGYLLNWESHFMGEPYAIVTDVNAVYVGSLDAQTSVPSTGSVLRTGQAGCLSATGPAAIAIPVSFVRNLSSTFTPPFEFRGAPAPGPVSAPAVDAGGLLALAVLLSIAGIVAIRSRRAPR